MSIATSCCFLLLPLPIACAASRDQITQTMPHTRPYLEYQVGEYQVPISWSGAGKLKHLTPTLSSLSLSPSASNPLLAGDFRESHSTVGKHRGEQISCEDDSRHAAPKTPHSAHVCFHL